MIAIQLLALALFTAAMLALNWSWRQEIRRRPVRHSFIAATAYLLALPFAAVVLGGGWSSWRPPVVAIPWSLLIFFVLSRLGAVWKYSTRTRSILRAGRQPAHPLRRAANIRARQGLLAFAIFGLGGVGGVFALQLWAGWAPIILFIASLLAMIVVAALGSKDSEAWMELQEELRRRYIPCDPDERLRDVRAIKLLRQEKRPQASFEVAPATSLHFFSYGWIPGAVAVTMAPCRTPPGIGVVVALPHPLTRDPVSNARLSEVCSLPVQRGEGWTLFSDRDAYSIISRPAVVCLLGAGPAGELWGWSDGVIFCIWLGPFSLNEIRALRTRCGHLREALEVAVQGHDGGGHGRALGIS